MREYTFLVVRTTQEGMELTVRAKDATAAKAEAIATAYEAHQLPWDERYTEYDAEEVTV